MSRWVDEARKRLRDCREGGRDAPCDDAQSDLQVVEQRRHNFERLDEQAKREAAETKQERAAYRRQRDADEAAKERIELEKQRERQADEARRAELQRVCAVDVWQRRQERLCFDGWTSQQCASPPEVAKPTEIEACKRGCTSAADNSAKATQNAALTRCVQGYVASEGKGAGLCLFEIPAGADDKYKQGLTECSAACQQKGKEAWAAKQKDLAEERKYVKCCDGSRSPSCMYGRGSMHGCCSHHGGICGG